MIAARPSHFVNRGSVLASGFIIRANIVGLTEARRRVLGLWRPNLQVKRIDDGLIVLLPEPVRVLATQAMGEPLVRRERMLMALPLELDETNLPHGPGDCVVFAKQGNVMAFPLAELPDERVDEWIDASDFVVACVASLGMPPAMPAFQENEFDARRDMPGVPPASSELQDLLAELRKERRTGVAGKTAKVRPGVPVLTRMRRYLRSLWLRLSQGSALKGSPKSAHGGGAKSSGLLNLGTFLVRVWRRLRGLAPQTTREQKAHRASENAANAAASQGNRLWLWLRNRANRLLNVTRMSRLIHSAHARYLARMVEMMQSGNLDEGLRHAIPLADAAQLTQHKKSWFTWPQRRPNLSINPYRVPAQSSVGLSAGLFAYLRNLYRQAFQRLEAQGRIEEAAFVLTELLASHAEAVSFLEKHGRLRLAAEIAEAHNLSPALAIRLWWLARDRKRAITLALRTGEFERAVQYLSVRHPAEADKLRLVWAEKLADAGKYLAAAEAIWPVKADRHFAHRWLSQAIEIGGTSGAIALARSGARFRVTFPDVLGRVEALMADETLELASARLAFADNVRLEARTPESQLLARLAVRPLVRDLQRGSIEFPPSRLRRLIDCANDPCLTADVPPFQTLKPASPKAPSDQLLEIAASDVGSRAISDLALLPDGRLLLALGEAGLLLVSGEGKTIAHLNEPAERLVVSDDGSRMIGIARRGPISRLVRIDVLARKASYWCDAAISAYAETFDGLVWSVASGADLFLIDALARGFEALWRIPDLDARIKAIRRSSQEDKLHVTTENPEHLTLWTYELPSFVLRSKQEFNAGPGEARLLPRKIKSGDFHAVERVRLPSASSAARERWLAVPVRQESHIDVFLFDVRSGGTNLTLRLHGSKNLALKFAEDVLLCGDDQGRVIALNILTWKKIRDLRI